MRIDVKKYLNKFKIGTKVMFKEFFKKETNKKQRANMWTFLRLIIPIITTIICIMTLFFTNTLPLLITSAGLTSFAAFTDYLDGKSARKHNSTSDYGKLLDQVSDKVFSGLTGICLSILNPLFLIILLGEAIISIINLSYKNQNPDLNISSTKIGRIKEWPLFITLGLGFISSLSPIINIITKLMIVNTFILQLATAGSYIKQNNTNLKNKDTNKKGIISDNTLNINLKVKKKNNVKVITKDNKIQELKELKNELINSYNSKDEKTYRLK